MNPTKKNQKKSPKLRWLHGRRRHDPMLALSMSLFNSGSSWDRIFSPIPERENVWGYR